MEAVPALQQGHWGVENPALNSAFLAWTQDILILYLYLTTKLTGRSLKSNPRHSLNSITAIQQGRFGWILGKVPPQRVLGTALGLPELQEGLTRVGFLGCTGTGVGLGDPWRSLPTQGIPGLFNSVSFLLQTWGSEPPWAPWVRGVEFGSLVFDFLSLAPKPKVALL